MLLNTCIYIYITHSVSCEYGHELSNSIKGGIFLVLPRNVLYIFLIFYEHGKCPFHHTGMKTDKQ